MGLPPEKSDATLARAPETNSTVFAMILEETWKKIFSQKQIGTLIKACMAGEAAFTRFICKIFENDTDIKAKYYDYRVNQQHDRLLIQLNNRFL